MKNLDVIGRLYYYYKVFYIIQWGQKSLIAIKIYKKKHVFQMKYRPEFSKFWKNFIHEQQNQSPCIQYALKSFVSHIFLA